MIIVISGSVGCGKTSFATLFSKRINSRIIHLNNLAKSYYSDYDKQTDSYEVDLEKLFKRVDKEIELTKEVDKDLIIEGHFAHLIEPSKVNLLIIISRPLEELKRVYKLRKYKESKISDNLEVEAFDTCYNEAVEEGFIQEKIVKIENTSKKKIEDVVDSFLEYYENY